MAQQTAVEWLQQRYSVRPKPFLTKDDFEEAKQLEKEQMSIMQIEKEQAQHIPHYQSAKGEFFATEYHVDKYHTENSK